MILSQLRKRLRPTSVKDENNSALAALRAHEDLESRNSRKRNMPRTPTLEIPFRRTFWGLVLGCIDVYDSDRRRVFEHFSRSIRSTFLRTTRNLTKNRQGTGCLNHFAENPLLATIDDSLLEDNIQRQNFYGQSTLRTFCSHTLEYDIAFPIRDWFWRENPPLLIQIISKCATNNYMTWSNRLVVFCIGFWIT